MEKFIEITYLFDFYHSLLTQKQQDIIVKYYFEDLSLAEIGEILNISRQGVYDSVKKAEHKLFEHEQKLKLWHKFKKQNNLLNQLEELEIDNLAVKDLIHQLRSEL
ncbi:hypothetical protein AN640_05395 [Candidatus Epulonipiscium fishelsonii]|uniref:Uncharacterized protein n=1 Tax=Candidatus Epulonipiscium fishelsonii TaxID=77094 RepID=A0ACC8XI65_9FIRM|nr:hypothetical protein AN640_05395 [Epulopiscium sp. SCG-D08WGA-EpuloA1]OON93085.1 MAG: hypothetical protein ATN32_01810 [Epulopiscium sp. AS2M-Bin002]